MKRLGILFLAGVVLISAGCMKKKRVSSLAVQSNINDPYQPDPPGGICEGGVNLFIRPDSASASNSFLVGQNVRFLLSASGCRFGYGIQEGGQFRPFNPGTIVEVMMPQSPESNRQEPFSVVAFDSRGKVHRGPYTFLSTPFNVSSPQVSLSFFPSRTISAERNSARFSISSNQPVMVTRVYSDEQNYLAQPVSTFSLLPGQFREVTLQLSPEFGGSTGKIKVDYSQNGITETTEITILHNVCEGVFRDDFLGIGRPQSMRFKCADGSIRVPLNLSEDLVSFWQVPAGYQFKDLMHGQIDYDNQADILFYAKKNNEPQKAYFFYGRSKPSTSANTLGGSYSIVLCSGYWEAPLGTTIPNQFSLVADGEDKPAQVFTIQSNGVRYQANLTVSGDSCSVGTVQLAPPQTYLKVSKEEVNSAETFSISWSASYVSGYQCKIEKKLTTSENWETVAGTMVTPTGSMVPERSHSQTITASTNYRAVCSKTINGVMTSVGGLPEEVKTVNVRAASTTNPSGDDGTNIRLQATSTSWIQTGIEVSGSNSLSVSATGAINLGPPLTNVGPNGVESSQNDCKFRSATRYFGGALLGKIGTEGIPFLIGANHLSNSRTSSGGLYLGINDPKCASNNSGYFDVMIQVSQ